MCVEIFGYRDPRLARYAIELGVALQLTNILRDVPGDLAAGRLYMPLEDSRGRLHRSRLQAEVADAGDGVRSPAVKSAARVAGERARDYYAQARDARCRARIAAAWSPRRSWGRSIAASSTGSRRPTTTCSAA